MRLAFWRRGDDKARVQRAVSKPAPATCNSTGARLIARHAKVVVFDLSASSPRISAVSVDPAAPGLADLMLGKPPFHRRSIGNGYRGFTS
jgi:hypothetical protein